MIPPDPEDLLLGPLLPDPDSPLHQQIREHLQAKMNREAERTLTGKIGGMFDGLTAAKPAEEPPLTVAKLDELLKKTWDVAKQMSEAREAEARLAADLLPPIIQQSRFAPRDIGYLITVDLDGILGLPRFRPRRNRMVMHPEFLAETLGFTREEIDRLPPGWDLVEDQTPWPPADMREAWTMTWRDPLRPDQVAEIERIAAARQQRLIQQQASTA